VEKRKEKREGEKNVYFFGNTIAQIKEIDVFVSVSAPTSLVRFVFRVHTVPFPGIDVQIVAFASICPLLSCFPGLKWFRLGVIAELCTVVL